MYFSYW